MFCSSRRDSHKSSLASINLGNPVLPWVPLLLNMCHAHQMFCKLTILTLLTTSIFTISKVVERVMALQNAHNPSVWQLRLVQCHQCKSALTSELPGIIQLGPTDHSNSHKRIAEAQKSKAWKWDLKMEEGAMSQWMVGMPSKNLRNKGNRLHLQPPKGVWIHRLGCRLPKPIWM